jgi:hypothetical protein
MIRLGILDCGSSHVVSFTRRLNHVDIEPDQWVEGARMVAAVPGESAERPHRMDGFVEQLRQWGVEILDRPEELIGRVDGVLLERVEGQGPPSRKHLERGLPILEAGLPLHVDKVFTSYVADAKQLVAAAQSRGVALSAGSAARHIPLVRDIRREEYGSVLGVDAYGPDQWHTLDMFCGLMGAGCRSVRCIVDGAAELYVGRWEGERLGVLRRITRGTRPRGFTAFCERQVVSHVEDVQHSLRDFLKVLVHMFESGEWPLSPEELVQPVALREAVALSRERGGEEVELAR